eukprot:CAMPEP_0113571918 /NCGR_PEP_ID=MMETSP0015_2-20120614/25816_1 /TAXON_ID=2838 /ORGANISM="Odontella" /LENGTH=32 /DNA_ID=CAMNT_0000474913 /DNA_START=382 /DNA_END=480 /DNA_ORIENTATION=- /assembly_acc=CAM_ASM_000160
MIDINVEVVHVLPINGQRRQAGHGPSEGVLGC